MIVQDANSNEIITNKPFDHINKSRRELNCISEENQDTRTDTKEEDGDDDEVLDSLPIVWRNVFLFALLHLAALFSGIFVLISGEVPVSACLKAIPFSLLTGMGITAGAHRLWTHRCYKATKPLEIFLLFLNTLCVQNSVYEWSRDHRVHHKFTETNADPHNIKRGFFFAHMGWLMCKKHPDVKNKGKLVDMSDLQRNPLVMWQHKYYIPLSIVTVLFIGPWLFSLLSGESWLNSIILAMCVRCTLMLHFTWSVNSFAHYWGSKPYDEHMDPVENKLVALVALGEGWHNYHHVFPCDYKTSEHGSYSLNFTTAFLDLCAKLGLAYDFKTATPEIIQERVKRTGDGSHPLWGGMDEDMKKEDTLLATKELHKNK